MTTFYSDIRGRNRGQKLFAQQKKKTILLLEMLVIIIVFGMGEACFSTWAGGVILRLRPQRVLLFRNFH